MSELHRANTKSVLLGCEYCIINKNDNAFIMFHEEIEYELEQEIGSGMVSISGKAYTFCMDADGDWSSTILMKTAE